MWIQLLNILAIIIAGSIVMILHELPKAIVYNTISKKQGKKQENTIFKVVHYIDPIGLIFCITSCAGFSKPYMYRIKEKKTNFLLGLTGFLSLILIFVISIIVLKINILGKMDTINTVEFYDMIKNLISFIIQNISRISLSMIIVNLFPISTFDMGLLIAGRSPSKYFSIIKNDYYIKLILLFTIILSIIETFSKTIIYYILH